MSDYPSYLRSIGMKEVKRDHVLQLVMISALAGLSIWSSMIIFGDEKLLKDIGKNTDTNYYVAQVQLVVWIIVVFLAFMKMFT
jgi:hypothetical protein